MCFGDGGREINGVSDYKIPCTTVRRIQKSFCITHHFIQHAACVSMCPVKILEQFACFIQRQQQQQQQQKLNTAENGERAKL